MENVQSWAVSAVFSAAVSAVVGLLVPNGAAEKSIKFMIAVFVLLMFVSPFASLDFSVSEYTKGVDGFIKDHELEDTIELQVKQVLVSQIQSSVSAYLTNIGVADNEIEVDIDIDEKSNINIKSIEIVAAVTNEQVQEIESYVLAQFGVVPKISGDENE